MGASRLSRRSRRFFFDDDTFTDNLPRAEAIARELGKLGVTWSCNAKANVPRETLKVLQGQRPAAAAGRLRDRQPADPAQHQEGHADRRRAASSPRTATSSASRSTARSSWACPARPRRPSRRRSVRHGDQSAHHPGFARRAVSRHVPLQAGGGERLARCRRTPSWSTITASRSRRCTIRTCRHSEIFDSVESSIGKFYFRAPKIAAIVGEMVRQPADDEAAGCARASSSSSSCASAARQRTNSSSHHVSANELSVGRVDNERALHGR